jgi:hypothetical protein
MRAGGTLAVVAAAAILATAALTVEFEPGGSTMGLYFLRGRRKLLEVHRDLYLDDEKRLLASVPFEPLFKRLRALARRDPAPPFLRATWDAEHGDGFVIQKLPGGRELVASFSRFRDDSGHATAGIFLGGSLPFAENRQAAATNSDTGMAYFDGQRWLHIWCSANEALGSARPGAPQIQPDDWEYLGSSLLTHTPREVVIADRHRVRIDGIPVRVEKRARFEAGEQFFTLTTRVTNEGRVPLRYRYEYGDEPWVGYYGTSLGDVGWTRAGLAETEGPIDTATTDFLGMYDFGNARVGEPHRYTGVAGFVEWDAGSTPDLAFFSNRVGALSAAGTGPPLRSMASRFLGMEWGPRTLAPGETGTFTVAVGMAQGSATPPYLPVKPSVHFEQPPAL